jgi:hypothetical protein
MIIQFSYVTYENVARNQKNGSIFNENIKIRTPEHFLLPLCGNSNCHSEHSEESMQPFDITGFFAMLRMTN